jgi:hypothetical protein
LKVEWRHQSDGRPKQQENEGKDAGKAIIFEQAKRDKGKRGTGLGLAGKTAGGVRALSTGLILCPGRLFGAILASLHKLWTGNKFNKSAIRRLPTDRSASKFRGRDPSET